MLQEQYDHKDTELWQNLVAKELEYVQSRQEFIRSGTNKITLIKKALQNPTQRGTALRFIPCLGLEERQSLFAYLVDLASVSHSDIELCREVILSFPKGWLVENIETIAEPLLHSGTDEEYRRLLELYKEIDWQLTQRLAQRALEHEDLDIREAGDDFYDDFLALQQEITSKIPHLDSDSQITTKDIQS